MKIEKITKIWANALVLIALYSCYGLDDDYATSSGLRLGFSTDTLSFDTILTSVGSATGCFMVYNRNDAPLLIKNIRLNSEGKTTCFRINVDGRNGSSFSDIRIESKDSLFIFVEATVEPDGSNLPFLVEDIMEFTVNGNKQYVVLQAYGQDVVRLKGGNFVEKDTVWTADKPYLIYDSVVINQGVQLKIEAGAVFYMHDKAKWVINGSMVAAGTTDKPIVFRGDRLDKLFSDLPFDLIPGLWDGLYFSGGSYNNELNNVVIKNGFRGIVCAQADTILPKLNIMNSQVTNMTQAVFEAVNCRINAVNTEFSNTSGAVVSLTGGNASFIHCTLVNFHRFAPARSGAPVLLLSNNTPDESGDASVLFPMNNATFINCIIDGSMSEGKNPFEGELRINRDEKADLFYSFNHCAVKTAEVQAAEFNSVRFIAYEFAPSYKLTGVYGSPAPFVFDYRPLINKDQDGKAQKDQPVVGQADTIYSRLYPFDRLGVPRLMDKTTSDTGAYEHAEEDENEK